MKHLFLAVIATGLIFATGCKKNEDTIPIKTMDWILIQKDLTQNGMTGNLYQDPINPKNQLFEVTSFDRAVGGANWTGTYSAEPKRIFINDEWVTVMEYSCNGDPHDCLIDDRTIIHETK